MSEFVALNGQTVTDAQLDAWESSYAQGKFPAGEKNLSAIIHGAPRACGDDPGTTITDADITELSELTVEKKH